MFRTLLKEMIVHFFSTAAQADIVDVLELLKAAGVMPALMSALETLDAAAAQIETPIPPAS